jgi:hypothetical protein
VFVLLSTDLNRDSKKVLRGQPRPGVDANVSAWSQLSVTVAAVLTAAPPGFYTRITVSRLTVPWRRRDREPGGRPPGTAPHVFDRHNRDQ